MADADAKKENIGGGDDVEMEYIGGDDVDVGTSSKDDSTNSKGGGACVTECLSVLSCVYVYSVQCMDIFNLDIPIGV